MTKDFFEFLKTPDAKFYAILGSVIILYLGHKGTNIRYQGIVFSCGQTQLG